jgi:hypothetical protein
LGKGLYLISWEEGVEGPEVLYWKKIKTINYPLDDLPKVLREMKHFSTKKHGPLKNKTHN